MIYSILSLLSRVFLLPTDSTLPLFPSCLYYGDRCSQFKSKFASCQSNSSTGFIDNDELRQNLDISMPGSEPMSIWINSLVLLVALVAFRSAGYLVLRFLRKPK